MIDTRDRHVPEWPPSPLPPARRGAAEVIERATTSRLILLRLLARLALAVDARLYPAWSGLRRQPAAGMGPRPGRRSRQRRRGKSRRRGSPRPPRTTALYDHEEDVVEEPPDPTPSDPIRTVLPPPPRAPRLDVGMGLADRSLTPSARRSTPAVVKAFIALRDLIPAHLAAVLAASLVTAMIGSALALGLVPGHGSGGSENASAFAVSATRPTGVHPTREAPLHVALAEPGTDYGLPPPPPPAAIPPAAPPPPTSALTWPIDGRVAQEFGHNGHPGIDIDAPYGTPIHAAGSGVVIWAGWQGGYGNFVLIDHGLGIVTGYGHQSRIAVSNGQTVTQGQVIGYEGSTGHSTGPHVHFEVRVNGVPRNPRLYVPGSP